MKIIKLWLCLAICWPLVGLAEDQPCELKPAPLPESGVCIEKIAIGSCHNQNFSKPSPIWKHIADESPQLVILMGDNVYSDTYDPEKYRRAYRKLKNISSFRSLFTSIPFLFTWDDHDYGRNDDGRDDHPNRDEAQRIFLEELHIDKDRRPWHGEGVYDAYIFGPEGKQTQIILLDTRSFRSALTHHPEGKRKSSEGAQLGRYVPTDDSTTTMLGAAQWQWLEEQLRKPADLRFIISSIQVLSNEHGWECWGNFPHERERLFRLIHETKAQGVILLSGDRHMAEFSKLSKGDDLVLRYPIFEFTSSAINMSKFANFSEPNPYRVKGTQLICENNYGLVQIKWEDADAKISLIIKNEKNNTLATQEIRLSELRDRDVQ
jgi:alkaline phosphatase D